MLGLNKMRALIFTDIPPFNRVILLGGWLFIAVAIASAVISSRKRADPEREAILNAGSDGICTRVHCTGNQRGRWRERLAVDNPTIVFQPDHTVDFHYEVDGKPCMVIVCRGLDGQWSYANPDTPSN